MSAIETAFVEIRPDTRGFGRETQRQVSRELAGVRTDVRGTARTNAALAGTNTQLRGIRGNSVSAASGLTLLGGAGARAGVLAGGGVAGLAAGITLIGVSSVKAAADFESSFAGVRKTVDATEEEFQQLGDAFLDLSKEIPVNVNELNRIGEAAGQLGIAKGAITDFTETVAELGVTTNLTSDQAADSLARIANITQLPQDQFDNLGSTIVELGNKMAATESEIVEFGLRIAGAGSQVGLSEAEVLAFGAALASVGLNAEAGGSAISTVFSIIAKNVASGGEKLKAFAKVAGQSSAEFADTFRDKPADAIIAFLNGLDQINESGGNVFKTLDDLGLGGIRVRDTLLRAAGAGNLVRDAIDTANTEWQENNALQEEAAKRFETTASQAQLLSNNLKAIQIAIGSAVLPAVNELTRDLSNLTQDAGENAAIIEFFGDLKQIVEQTSAALEPSFGLIEGGIQDLADATGELAPLIKPLAILFGATLVAAITQAAFGFRLLAGAVKIAADITKATTQVIIAAIDGILAGFSALADAASHLPIIGDSFKGVSDDINGARETLRGFSSELDGIDGKTANVVIGIDVQPSPDVRDMLGAGFLPGGGFLSPDAADRNAAATAAQNASDAASGDTDAAAGPRVPRGELTAATKLREQRLQDEAELARLTANTLADDRVALRNLIQFYTELSNSDRFKAATRRSFLIAARTIQAELDNLNKTASDDAKSAADKAKQDAKDKADAAVEEQRAILEANVRIAATTENIIRDDRVAYRKLIAFLKERVKLAKAGSAAARAAQADLKQAQADLAEINKQARDDRLDAREDELQDRLTLAELNDSTIKDDERALRALIRFYAARKRAAKNGSDAERKFLIEQRRAEKQLRDLRKQNQEQEGSFQKLGFEFLQQQTGFFSQFASNLFGPGTGGVGGQIGDTAVSGARATAATAAFSPAATDRATRAIDQAQAIEDAQDTGMTKAQAATLIQVERNVLAELRQFNKSVGHQRNRASNRQGRASSETEGL